MLKTLRNVVFMPFLRAFLFEKRE